MGVSPSDGERPLNRVVLHLNPLLSQLLGSPTVYEDEILNVLTEKGLITAVSREMGLGGGVGGRGKKSGDVGANMGRKSSNQGTPPPPGRPSRKPTMKNVVRAKSVANAMANLFVKEEDVDATPAQPKLTARDRWRLAVKHTKEMAKLHSFDPWWDRSLHELRSELCVRYDFDPETKEWHESETLCKMEREQFAEGAMRRCFRMKKLSQSMQSAFIKLDWRHCPNYVAKEYKDDDIRGRRDVVFDDVRMQMTAKHWGNYFNLKHPPKQVDFIQCFVLELPDRPGSPVFCCERLIPGEYIKYNNNSGYIDEDHLRSTPQAFSHFTFNESKGAEMVVDVQGVGDLYTDPQFHTADGKEYGEGNLGHRGMAQFLSTHHCDDLCRLLGLPPFVLSPKRRRELHVGHLEHVRHVMEIESGGSGDGGDGADGIAQGKAGADGAGGDIGSSSTGVSSTGGTAGGSSAHSASISTSSKGNSPAGTAFRARSAMLKANNGETPGLRRKNSSNPLLATLFRQVTSTALSIIKGEDTNSSAAAAAARDLPPVPLASLPRWVFALGDLTDEEAVKVWELENKDIGGVHLSMARLDVDEEVPATESAMFHLAEAARNGDGRALRGLYDILRGVPQSAVPGLKLEEEADPAVAAAVLTPLAESGDCDAMMEAADAAAAAGDSTQAVEWLERVEEAINAAKEAAAAAAAAAAEGSGSDADEQDDYYSYGYGGDGAVEDDDSLPDRLTVLQKLAEAVRPTDPERSGNLYSEAAELATSNGKGKLAMKLGMLAEEAWGEMEED